MKQTVAGIRVMCLVGLHPWPPWSQIVAGKSSLEEVSIQTRTCPECNKVEIRQVRPK